MTTTERHQLPASLETIMAAIRAEPLSEGRLTEVAQYVAALVADNVELRAACTALAQENVEHGRRLAVVQRQVARLHAALDGWMGELEPGAALRGTRSVPAPQGTAEAATHDSGMAVLGDALDAFDIRYEARWRAALARGDAP